MLVKMLKTELGVNDGKMHPDTFVEGETYEIGPDLHRAFSGMGIIKDVEPEPEPEPEPEKQVKPEPEKEPEKAVIETVEEKQKANQKKGGKKS